MSLFSKKIWKYHLKCSIPQWCLVVFVLFIFCIENWDVPWFSLKRHMAVTTLTPGHCGKGHGLDGVYRGTGAEMKGASTWVEATTYTTGIYHTEIRKTVMFERKCLFHPFPMSHLQLFFLMLNFLGCIECYWNPSGVAETDAHIVSKSGVDMIYSRSLKTEAIAACKWCIEIDGVANLLYYSAEFPKTWIWLINAAVVFSRSNLNNQRKNNLPDILDLESVETTEKKELVLLGGLKRSDGFWDVVSLSHGWCDHWMVLILWCFTTSMGG